MYSAVTRTLRALPPALIGAGFAIRTTVNPEPPVSFNSTVEPYVLSWSWAFEFLCLGAVILSLMSPKPKTLQLLSTTQLVLSFWVFTLGIALVIAGTEDPSRGIAQWIESREWISAGAALGVGFFFIHSWWDLIHFHIPQIHEDEKIRRLLTDDNGSRNRQEE